MQRGRDVKRFLKDMQARIWAEICERTGDSRGKLADGFSWIIPS